MFYLTVLAVSSFYALVALSRISLNSGGITFLAKSINSASLGLDLQQSSTLALDKITDAKHSDKRG
jgi:hypothetical protein